MKNEIEFDAPKKVPTIQLITKKNDKQIIIKFHFYIDDSAFIKGRIHQW